MSRFDECMAWVTPEEGGYVDNPDDHGGATNCGVTQATYDRYRMSCKLILQPVKLMTPAEKLTIFQEWYFNPAHCPQLPVPVDLVMFDAWVQHRPDVAAKFLQCAVDVNNDGVIGSQTLRAVVDTADVRGALSIAKNIIAQRRQFYITVAAKNPSQIRFLKGWLNRMDDLTREIQK